MINSKEYNDSISRIREILEIKQVELSLVTGVEIEISELPKVDDCICFRVMKRNNFFPSMLMRIDTYIKGSKILYQYSNYRKSYEYDSVDLVIEKIKEYHFKCKV
ncbi:gp445 [Bacillus phage G]|uniref:Gp445 n=1 Tax=Bacillus phage G TaxID=2884420 RepID=G3MAI6_9CAUD|nr:gp445 [Bacillus phage G]AEO93703.1 gp445 [Bacillus phage G]